MKKLFACLLAAFSILLSPPLHAQAPDAPAASAAAAEAAIAPEKLTQGTLTAQEYAFKQDVYRRHVARGVKSGRVRVYDLPASELALVPSTKTVMRQDAASALGKLLTAARADLATDLAATGTDPTTVERHTQAARVQDIALNNAYRSASHQFHIWDRNFLNYYNATQAQRRQCPGGEFGPAAADLLRDYIGVLVAAPGFSNHQGGIAVDFELHLKPVAGTAGGGQTLSASKAQTSPWKDSWFWNWLNRRAANFGFVAYLPEPWHWEYRPDAAGKSRT